MAQAVQTALQVDPQQGDDRATGEASAPLKTICQALRLAIEGTVIQLSAGQYSVESGEEFPLQIPAGVTLLGNISTRGAEIVITGGGAIDSPTFGQQTVTLLLGAAQIRGITVTNPLPQGTGIWVESVQSPTSCTIAHCTIAHCEREGILVAGAAIPAIANCLLQANRASGIAFVRYAKGEVRRCVIRENRFGIVLSDRSAPLLVDNQITQNQTGILISGTARPVLRHNAIAQNHQVGLVVSGAAQPNLGNPQDPASNRFQENGAIDLHNHTTTALNTVGNQLNPLRVKGTVNFLRVTSPTLPPTPAIAPTLLRPDLIPTLLAAELIEPSQLDSFASRNHFVELMLRALPLPDWDASDPDQTTDRPLTRLDSIAILTRHLGLTTGNLALLDVYRDRAQISDQVAQVAAATQHRLIALPSGVSSRENRLQPLQPIRQAEAAAMIYQAIETRRESADFSQINFATVQISPANVAFGDIQNHWATDFIRAVAAWGAIGGDESGNFRPDQSLSSSEYAQIFGQAADPMPQPISRLQVWRSLLAWRSLELQLPEVDLMLLDRYEDAPADSDGTAIALATQLRLVFNYPLLRQLCPNQSVTRAEMAAIAYQILHYTANAPAIDCPYLIDPDRADQPQPRVPDAPRFVLLELEQEAVTLEPISLINPLVDQASQADLPSLEAIAAAVTRLLNSQDIEVLVRSPHLPTDSQADYQGAEAQVGITLMSSHLPDRVGVAVFHPIGIASARLAQALHKTILRSLDLPSRGIHRETREASEAPAIPTARIEIGRVTYSTDRPEPLDLNYCQAVGQAIGEAIYQLLDSAY